MGIPGFFNSISKNYKIGISSAQKIINPNIYIDFNSLIYTAKYIVQDLLLNYVKSILKLEYKTDLDFSLIPSSLKDALSKESLNTDAIEDRDALHLLTSLREMRDQMIFTTIGTLLSNILIQTVDPKVLLYIDGVPFIGKMIEQRKRALLSGLIVRGKEIIIEHTKPDKTTLYISNIIEPLITLDKNVIKPGTFFMNKLLTWLRSKYPDWYMDDFTINGEAEHKIINDIIKNKPSKRLREALPLCPINDILVYSPDADMIILLLPLILSNKIYLVRDSIDKTVYSLDKLKEDIIEHLISLIKNESKLKKSVKEYKQRLIYDICFIYNIFGNDFLPKLDNVNIYEKTTLTRILMQYSKYLHSEIAKFNFTDIFLITETNNVNWYGYTKFLELLNKEFTNPKIEKSFIYTSINKLDSSKYSDQMYSLNNFGKGVYNKNEDKYIWNKDFYSLNTFFETSDINSINLDYCIGIIMVDLLYSKKYIKELSVEEKQVLEIWYYPHHKAPLIQDIFKWLQQFISKDKFDIDKFKIQIKSHLSTRLAHYPKLFIPDYIYQLYYITPNYDEFIKLTNADKSKYPKLKYHELYEQFVSQLKWSDNKLNLSDLLDCNLQRFIDKCIPLLKINNHNINLVFEPINFIV
jgi:5'-3' exonuclease